MPYVSDPNLDENQKNQGSQSELAGQVSGQPNTVSGSTGNQSQIQNQNSATQAPAAPTLASGTGLTGESGSGGTGKETFNSSTPTSSGQWTNLQNYLDANNGGQFGQDFSKNIGNDITKAQSSIDNAATRFQSGVDAGTLKNNENVVSQVGAAPEKMTAEDQDAFKKQLNASYTGPQNAADDASFQGANSQAHSAFTETQQAQNPGGKQALLEKFYNTPNYTSGEKALDTAILSSDPNAAAAISSLAKDASNLPVNYQSAAKSANDYAGAGAGTTAGARKTARTALGIDESGNIADTGIVEGQPTAVDEYGFSKSPGAIDALLRSLDQKVGGLKGRGQAPTSLEGLGLTKDQLGGSYMIDPITGKQISLGGEGQGYGVNAFGSNYYTPGGNADQLNRGNVASTEEAARLNALQQLAGMNSPIVSNINEAGTMTNGVTPFKFQQENFLKDRGTAQAKYQAAAYKAGLDAQTAYNNAPKGDWIDNGTNNSHYAPVDPTQYENQFKASLEALKKQYGIT